MSPFDNIMFTIVPIIVICGFVFIFGTIIFRSIQGAKKWKQNNNSPVLTVPAVVVTKRTNVGHHHHNTGAGAGDMHHTSSYTTYFVTFEVESGDRMEFAVQDSEYGMLVEKDGGRLTFQGTRYMGFERLL